MCLQGHSGSDGDGNVGSRRDCGRLDPFGDTLNEFRGKFADAVYKGV